LALSWQVVAPTTPRAARHHDPSRANPSRATRGADTTADYRQCTYVIRSKTAPRAVEITWAHRISVSAPAAPAADSDIGIGDRPGRPPAGPALRSADEFLMSRSDRRIDRPLLPASCPVCGHVVLRADGCPGRVPPAGVRCPATGAITPPGRNRCGPSAAASTGMSAARCAGGHRPVGRPPLRTADVRHRCRITVGRPNPCRTTAICDGCAGADACAVVSSSRASGPVGGHTDEHRMRSRRSAYHISELDRASRRAAWTCTDWFPGPTRVGGRPHSGPGLS
jgi:hypothetical protein